MIFWEWKTGRIKSRLRAHSKVVIAHEWLPHETVSRFFVRMVWRKIVLIGFGIGSPK